MKKMKKLSLEHLAQESIILTPAQQMALYAGSGIDGLCFFEALEIMSAHFGCNYDINYYINSFGNTYGWSFVAATESGRMRGVDSTYAFSFLSSNFAFSSIAPSDYQSALSGGSVILTAFDQGNGEAHAIVVTGYNSGTGKYICVDNGHTYEISSSQFLSQFTSVVTDGYTH